MKAPARAPSLRKPPVRAAASGMVTPIAAGKLTPRRLRRSAEILAAAREVFLEKGFERASVGEIAARVGVVEGLVYTYFPSKRDLLNEVLRGMYEPLIQDIADGFSRIHGLRSRLRFVVWRHLRVYVEEPSLSRLVLHEVRTSPDYFKSVLHHLQVRYTSFLLRTLHEAMAAGELPADTDVETVRSMVYGGLEHRMWSLLYGRGSIDVEAMADRYTAMLLHGVLAPRAAQAQARPAAAVPAADKIERRLARIERIVATQLADTPAPPAAASRRRKAVP
jgi:AcrR family transcriptional regulator